MDYPVEAIYQVPGTDLIESTFVKYCPYDYDWYKIIKIKDCPFGSGIKYVVVNALSSPKCNVYGTHNEFNAYILVKYYRPLALVDAKIIYPEMNFGEDNYGFEKLFVPGDI